MRAQLRIVVTVETQTLAISLTTAPRSLETSQPPIPISLSHSPPEQPNPISHLITEIQNQQHNPAAKHLLQPAANQLDGLADSFGETGGEEKGLHID